MHRVDDGPLCRELPKNYCYCPTNRVCARTVCLHELRSHSVDGTGSLNEHTPRHANVVNERFALDLQLQFSDSPVLDALATLEQTPRAADVDQPRRDIPGQHAGDFEPVDRARVRLHIRRLAAHPIQPTIASRSRWRTTPSTNTGTLLVTRTLIVTN